MSTSTAIFFAISASTFAILLMLAVALFLRNRSSTGSDVAGQEVDSIVKQSYSCDVEVVILEDTVQITNMEDKPMRLEASSSKEGIDLVSSDQWIQRLGEGVNTYRVFASSVDQKFEQVSMELKVTSTEVAVRPVIKDEATQVIIWKLKPVMLSGEKHLVERQVFSGRLQKTVNFDRVSGKYFKIEMSTQNSKRVRSGLESGSNIGLTENYQLLSFKIESHKVQACNVSKRRMEVAVCQANSQSTLKRRLTEEFQEMPLNGTFSFSILPGKSEDPKDLLRIRLSDQTVLIEPHVKFGTVPLVCDVRSPGRSQDEEFSQIISGEVLSELQLPRKSYCYILTFYMRVASSTDAETSYTLQ